MRVSVNWLKELVDIDLNPEDLGRILTIAGFEVESLEDLGKNAAGVVIGKVITCDRHPDADKLSVCQVNVGEENNLNIVCGAANVRADIYVAVATIGTYLPAVDLKIRRSKLRGVSSEGMICSLSELGLQKESPGIYIFDADNLKPGQDIRPLLGLDDVILDLATTANRADALSMVGIAREVAALTGGNVRLPEIPQINLNKDRTLNINISDPSSCPAYIGTVIEEVKIAPSPNWLQWRLQGAGVRPINNVVDITNYMLLEWGQPLHAFDREKLLQVAGSDNLTLGVRFAEAGENLITLDGQNRDLTTQNLLITAENKPIALAGVMGGETTEVDSNTQNIVLEAALFDPVAIRRSSRSQNLRSEASTRYERGVNQVELDRACQRAIALLQELARGKVVSQSIADNRIDFANISSIELRLSRIHQILGTVEVEDGIGYIKAEEVESILTTLGCKLELVADKENTWRVKVPAYRYRDLEREIDLIEEVARLYGYDRFSNTLPAKTEPGYLSAEYRLKNKLREAFRGVGLTEVVHYSLVKPTGKEITLANPLFSEYSALRADLRSGLLDAFQYNQSQGNGALNAFEMERVFLREETSFTEVDMLAGIIGGNLYSQGIWVDGGKPNPMSWYEAKGILESVFQFLDLKIEYRAENLEAQLHPGRTASLWLDGKRLGSFGQLHPQEQQKRDLPYPVYLFELTVDVLSEVLPAEASMKTKFKAYSTYPGAARDLAFFASLDLSVAEITETIELAGGKLLQQVELFDEYKGKNVPEGQRSLAFNLVYRSGDRTLTDADIEPLQQKVRKALVKEFNVTLRS
jgi:phenylalanyl-tRNA synthetase beta chain